MTDTHNLCIISKYLVFEATKSSVASFLSHPLLVLHLLLCYKYKRLLNRSLYFNRIMIEVLYFYATASFKHSIESYDNIKETLHMCIKLRTSTYIQNPIIRHASRHFYCYIKGNGLGYIYKT